MHQILTNTNDNDCVDFGAIQINACIWFSDTSCRMLWTLFLEFVEETKNLKDNYILDSHILIHTCSQILPCCKNICMNIG